MNQICDECIYRSNRKGCSLIFAHFYKYQNSHRKRLRKKKGNNGISLYENRTAKRGFGEGKSEV